MKKRKIKLLASLTSLVLVVAVMAVGVWAATSAQVNLNSHIQFTGSKAVKGEITMVNSVDNKTYKGSIGSTAANVSEQDYALFQPVTGEGFETWTAADGITLADFVFADNDGNGAADTLSYTLKFTWASQIDKATTLTVNATRGEGSVALASGYTWGTENTGLITYTITGISDDAAANGTAEITVTFTFSGDCSTSVAAEEVQFNVVVTQKQ